MLVFCEWINSYKAYLIPILIERKSFLFPKFFADAYPDSNLELINKDNFL